ncbi:potassium channel KOR1-like isoform X2 [Pseudomyrmex gracilis]|uniref:potassium channel KOR1-like isoform X2 n=1 Tax=Pseudomyrmex gracilis TaxID=219809 RepID=UPI0009951DB4|nr:potassium channel KOR1-like isoform X2 [Pseudomyrmex gracilis]
MRTVVMYSRKLYYAHRINFYLFKIAEIGIIIVLCVHWAACLEYYLPLIVGKIFGPNEKSWIRSVFGTNKKTKLTLYFECVNRAVTSLVGSTHFFPVSTFEDMLLNLILSVIGFLGFIYLLARLAQLITTFNSTRKRHLKLIQQLEQYMKHHRLSHPVQQRLRAYYNYRNKKGFERNEKIIDYVSPYLREHNYQQLLNNVVMFKHMPKTIATQLIGCIRSEIFMSNDVLVRAGTISDALYFIASGTVAVYNDVGKEICHLEDGASFDELALLMENELRMATVVAVENCEVYILTRVDFQRIFMFYPDIRSQLQNIVLASVEKMSPLERESSSTLSRSINISSILRRKSRGDVSGSDGTGQQ